MRILLITWIRFFLPIIFCVKLPTVCFKIKNVQDRKYYEWTWYAKIYKISKVQYGRTSVIRILYYRFTTRTSFTRRKFDSTEESLLTIDDITVGQAIQLQFNWRNCCYLVAYVWVDVKCMALDKLWTTVGTRYRKAIYYTYNKWKIILRQM